MHPDPTHPPQPNPQVTGLEAKPTVLQFSQTEASAPQQQQLQQQPIPKTRPPRATAIGDRQPGGAGTTQQPGGPRPPPGPPNVVKPTAAPAVGQRQRESRLEVAGLVKKAVEKAYNESIEGQPTQIK